MHNRNEPSFFFMNSTGAPQGEWLGRMNPFSIISSNWTFSSFSSAGASRYGAREIGAVPGINSMLNTISLSGGNPGKSFGNTDTYSLTTGTSSGVNSVSLLGSTILARNPLHPLLSNLLAFRAEIIGTARFRGVPWNSKDFAFNGWKRTRFFRQSITA